MLKELRIENLAIIKELELEFSDKLIALTGETGAGKSIILNGINLLIGEKVSMDMLRDGEEVLLAEGVFEANEIQIRDLQEMGIDVLEDSEIIVQRRFHRTGRGKAFVNGRRVTIKTLKEIMRTLVDIIGQHSHQLLLDKKLHIKLLDKFLTSDSRKIKESLVEVVEEYLKVESKLKELERLKGGIREKKNFYEFQLNEINELDLSENEDEELEQEYKRLFNAGKIKENLYESNHYLKDGENNVLSFIYNARKNIESLVSFDKEFERVYKKLDSVYYELEDISYTVDNLGDNFDIDEFRLNEVGARLDKIKELKRKYGSTIKEIFSYRDEMQNKLNLLENSNFETKELLKRKERLLKEYGELAETLSNDRKKIAKVITGNLHSELKYLNMKDAKFDVSFVEREKISKEGRDSVEFLVATNVGQSFKPLSKVASGGEMSRIMLALKVIFSKVDNIPILVFDEIDTGVGGETVKKVADKLKEIGLNSQIVCITHSPAIASKANQQFYIEKKVVGEKTITTVIELGKEERVEEIARMLAGNDISETVRTHARELLQEGEKR